MAQLPLDLGRRPALGRDAFLVAPSNSYALSLVEAWETWPEGKLALVGPHGSGKTHLAHVWAGMTGARILTVDNLHDASPAGGNTVVEGADQIAQLPADLRATTEEALFHLHNGVLNSGGRLLITGRTAPTLWSIKLPDLASRLKAMTVAELEPPDDTLLAGIMVKLFADRQIRVAPNVISYLVRRIERSIPAAEQVVSALDAAALSEGRAVSRPLAKRILETTA